MQFRRSMMSSVMVLLLAGVATLAIGTAYADDVLYSPYMRKIENTTKARLAKLRTNVDPGDPDTVFIGHVFGATGLPGVAGGYGPFHIGRGRNRPTSPLSQSGPDNNGYWNFDSFNAGETDTYQGWWVLGMPFQGINAAAARRDWWWPFGGFDWGNAGNHPGNGLKPTFGVTGYWHRDAGSLQAPVASSDPNNGPAPGVAPNFTPAGGSGASAWCGLRAHGDFAYTDPITRGVYNSDIVVMYGDNHAIQTGASNPVGKTDANFPGYGDQWDQMLYRDIAVTESQDLILSWEATHKFKGGHQSLPETRQGWFNMDPTLDVQGATYLPGGVPQDGNRISSSVFEGLSGAADRAPEDSFMVYIGVPVNDGAVTYTDGSSAPVGDPLRRWFSEVIKIDGWTAGALGTGDIWPATIRQLVSRSGTFSGAEGITVTAAELQAILDADGNTTNGGTVRLVFRVKTNRGFSDEDGYVSDAVPGVDPNANVGIVVDNVMTNGTGWVAATGNFDAVGSINNSVAATSAWRSTGKSVGHDYWVMKNTSTPGFSYFDPCGPVGGPGRLCNLIGNVMSPEPGFYAENDMDKQRLLLSPTINLKASGNGGLNYNDMGIDQEIAETTNEYGVYYDMMTNFYWTVTTGNAKRVGWQSFPGVQKNGVTTWATFAKTIGFFNYGGTYGCFVTGGPSGGAEGLGNEARANGLVVTTNGGNGSATDVPDSIRAGLEAVQTCFRRGSTSPASCGAFALPDNRGGYVDNISIGLIDGLAAPAIAQGFQWDMGQDAFPNDGTQVPGTEGFRRAPIRVNSAYNIGTGTPTGKVIVPGDTMLIVSSGTNVRTDLVFRIKPGPGNYVTVGQPTTGLRTSPGVAVTAVAGDGSFWGSYMGNRGLYGTGYVGGGTPTAVPNPMTDRFAGGAVDWDPDQWLSARCDTAERNLFHADGTGNNNIPLNRGGQGQYMSAYHESELVAGGPRATLGVVKNRCVLIDPTVGSNTDMSNVACDDVSYNTVPPHPSGKVWSDRWNIAEPINYVTSLTGGYVDGTCNGACVNGTTAEFTKIIPNGQLTPGGHIEFFFRRTFVGNFSDFDMLPDTTLIVPNVGNFDGARWYAINALPDEWKNPAHNDFGQTPQGLACMLFVDQGDRRAEELTWNGMAEAIGLTTPQKYGAGTGYYIGATDDFPGNLTELNTPATTPGGVQVSKNLGQVGTYFDMYNVRAGESNTPSGRLGSRDGPACVGLATGKCGTAGPTKPWLRQLYQNLFVDCADLKDLVWGPELDQTDDDIGMFTAFINQPLEVGASTRNFIVTGNDISAGMSDDGSGDPTFFPNYFDASLQADSYRDDALSSEDIPDLEVLAPIGTAGTLYGFLNTCLLLNDVLTYENAITGSAVAAEYEDTNPLDGEVYVSGVYAPADGTTRYANTLLLSFTHGAFVGIGSRFTLGRAGYNAFWFDALTTMIGTICGNTLTNPVGVGDNPGTGKAFVNFMNLRSPNPMRSGTALIEFGLSKSERVQVNVYDVTGRLVKTLAEREFKGGETHKLTWDGTDVGGRTVARGVYFYQLRSPSFTSQKKLTVLRD